MAFSLVAMVVFGAFFRWTRLGLAMRATATDQQADIGIDVGRIFAVSWAIACAVSPVGGALLSAISGVNLGVSHFGLKVFPAVIFGGVDSIVGAAIGGVLIGVIENVADGVFKSILDIDDLRDVAAFALLVVVLMVRPYGLFGQRAIARI
ncbi:MAG: branched-chain amino acid ABC transporter permease [Phreatobacter sp.]|uniref:branched-chain amino acid ABC transporter permease n=1 Tax=Phreatobacter sp. TaxID=1966341 RepID=UPI001A383561|nr:branched-chain amino acid ABC transporter permease [Phreatobacter sp.]MBL8569564.1 branched-chain amino acid ABC transporter permease [Phreatobacter sp.]